MSHHIKIQQFKNQIRRRQKQKIISDLRAKLYYCTQNQDLSNSLSQWKDFLKNPSPKVPSQAIKYFINIQFENIQQIQQIVNQLLDPQNLINVIFVTLMIDTHQINSNKFFAKVLDCQKRKENFEEISRFTKVKNQQQLYLDYFIKYLLKLNPKQKVTSEDIIKIKKYFVDYWNQFVKQKSVNYKLCAQITQRFMKFKNFIDLDTLIKGVTSVLIEEDDSPQTYFLVKMTLSCDMNSSFCIVLNPNFPDFIFKGFKQNTLKTVLQIVEIIMQRVELYEKMQIKYFQLLKVMYRVYMKTQMPIFENYLLSGFYNFAFSQIKQVEKFFMEIDYEQMFLKTKAQNLLNFLDFCICVLYNYPSAELYKKIINGKILRLLVLSCEHIFIISNKKTWQFAKDLFQSMQKCEQHKITQNNFPIQLQTIKNKLQALEWKVNTYDKQELINNYESLIQKCKQRQKA